ncbi:MAG: DUF1015 domain-containing protein [Christensenellales bacterium]|jgi:uncharacterized protein (DUF1015 family)
MALSDYALSVPDILIPAPWINPEKWAVISCDQYTSQPEYWKQVESLVGDAPSTLHLTYPEVYLGKDEARFASVSAAMEQAVSVPWVVPLRDSMLYLRRQTSYHRLRQGLVTAVDLEAFTFAPGGKGLIRSTEGVVMDRIPPRLAIRRQAQLEVPHIMLLVDDPEDRLFSALNSLTQNRTPVYDFDLMLGAGHATGFPLAGADFTAVETGLTAILERALEQDAVHPMLMAVGDGNHSLVTAKTYWEELKEAGAPSDHPARHALVEIVNLHDPGLGFEPIHRVVFTPNPAAYLSALTAWLAADSHRDSVTQKLHCILQDRDMEISAQQQPNVLQAEVLQEAFVAMEEHFQATVDYIHGEDAVRMLVSRGGALGFLMPPFNPASLFPYVSKRGSLPKKSFSLGHADEKRFYVECRSIL